MYARTQSGSLAGIGALTRVFTGDKIIESRWLNIAGVQVLRTIAARAAWSARTSPAADVDIRGKAAALARDGAIVWPDFLPATEFDALRHEVAALFDGHSRPVETRWDGPNHFNAVRLSRCGGEEFPRTRALLGDRRIVALFEAAEKRALGHLAPYGEIERLVQGPIDEREDPQTVLHSDTFFNTHKAWLYLTDVEPADATFTFVRGSHALTFDRLRRIYAASCDHRPGVDFSRRVTDEELRANGLEETVITCPRNTLVVANTCAYHRRTRGAPGRVRDAVHVSVRANPFSALLPGFVRRALGATTSRARPPA